MRCHECGGTYRTRKGTLRLPDDVVKLLVVPDVEYLECDECGELMFPFETAKKIGDTRDREISEFLRSRPSDDFISATGAAAMLGISRQALQKHRRISRGFVYQRREGRIAMYLKDSGRQFKETGDGRIPLSVSAAQPHR
jgi:hypothetical protein